MADKAYLVLADGSVHQGESFGADVAGHGEVVFNTSMTGYQEVLTDPSYAGQMVTLTYPMVGNYGINREDIESRRIQVRALIVREHCDQPSHGNCELTLHEYLKSQGIPGIAGVDTRAITRRLRNQGVMMGMITTGSPEAAIANLAGAPRYDDLDLVSTVSTEVRYTWEGDDSAGEPPRYRILVTDGGLKYNILRLLKQRGCEVIAVPAATSADEILSLQPSGVLMSPGPGDPQLLDYVTANVKQLLGRVPMMGICLGHQLIARAMGATTYKLKFGHRGANHPVKDLGTGRVYITAQNHGYAVDADSLPAGLEVSRLNLNDYTVEGLSHRDIPLLTIQYHSEASPGPRDNEYVFDKFLEMIGEFRAGRKGC
ncbi:MAG TPA: glutamine-hydrolyzing carbamoyl-phosphate synthase small subunit [Dehalococcoidia bacterium]|nr:glutamine-hydrolyzing carbamoyl-phosphate synthase small subunit [Dehalococcoidia bacterium]